MSDFYQILKREISPAEEQPVEKKEEEKNQTVSRTDDLPLAKKIPLELKNRKKRVKKIAVVDNLKKKSDSILSYPVMHPIWLTLSEAAKLGGVQKITIKRALRSGTLKYRISENRYQVDMQSLILYFLSRKKLWNKLKEQGLGQFIEKWRA